MDCYSEAQTNETESSGSQKATEVRDVDQMAACRSGGLATKLWKMIHRP